MEGIVYKCKKWKTKAQNELNLAATISTHWLASEKSTKRSVESHSSCGIMCLCMSLMSSLLVYTNARAASHQWKGWDYTHSGVVTMISSYSSSYCHVSPDPQRQECVELIHTIYRTCYGEQAVLIVCSKLNASNFSTAIIILLWSSSLCLICVAT